MGYVAQSSIYLKTENVPLDDHSTKRKKKRIYDHDDAMSDSPKEHMNENENTQEKRKRKKNRREKTFDDADDELMRRYIVQKRRKHLVFFRTR